MSEHEKPEVPEIFTKRVQRPLSQEDLEMRILAFLASRRLCVLSTCRNNIPRSTPILFRSKGLTLFMAGEPGQKLGNIKQNPNVSVGVFDPKSEFSDDIHDITGLQIRGHGRLLRKEDPGFMEAFRLFGRPEAWTEHWFGMMIEVVPERIELLAMGLKLEGYAARQIWTRPGA
ncbi:MAG: pyridoxamine 5'-phosphate oxidase family protein [Chlorobium sp.]|uniref:pyridoxamine 5'-phosphate oxidase family protein n=1 Tax=Chlorobium sp. TaxID=1095 RepID=UPI0025BCA4F7|nr:pyridoxamine 5'-phosphate oxidase family protein [Chlorobium sp.]MCF8382326.1 pyridoxamine 5'-phosphate oxidase family protein [Chlorobium sp.]